MTWFDDLKNSIFTNQTLAEDITGFNLKQEYNKVAQQQQRESQLKAETQANVLKTEAAGRAEAISKGFTLEQGLLGSTTRAGSPQSGLEQNQGINFLDILKWNSQNAPSAFQETGKDKASSLVVNTPEGSSQTKTTPEGTTITQKAGSEPSANVNVGSWLPIVIVAGLVIIVIVVIRK